MGCDGGTIPKRHELVKGPKKVEKVRANINAPALKIASWLTLWIHVNRLSVLSYCY